MADDADEDAGSPAAAARRSSLLLVVVGGLAFSTSGPLARYARPAHPALIVFGRLVIAALVLAAIDARGLAGDLRRLPAARLLRIGLAGAILAAHFLLFVWGLDRTSLPAAVSLVALEPVTVVLCMWAIHKLKPSPVELVGITLATLGAVWMGRGAGTGDHRLDGDLMVLGAVVLYGLYIAGAKAFRGDLPAGRYAALVYAFAALFVAPILIFVPLAPPPHSWLAIAGVGLIPTLIGHTMVQAAAKTARPAVVALVSPGETLGALILGAVWLHTIPSTVELWGAAVILLGTVIVIAGRRGD